VTGVLKLIIYLLFIYLAIRLFRFLFALPGGNEKKSADEEDMVLDPECQTYIPRSQALKAKIGGEHHFFCSRECMDKFRGDNKD